MATGKITTSLSIGSEVKTVPVGTGTGVSPFVWKSAPIQCSGEIVAVLPILNVTTDNRTVVPLLYNMDTTQFALYGTASDNVPCQVIYKK